MSAKGGSSITSTAHIREFIELQSNVESESKDGLVGKA
jgi:hypothetical protein